ncbi:phosphate regulon sensor histidine kinase PhoR [Thiolapillus brandeum]|uniref:Phosphate regulon sensor protein PhoR n=1 Tax=Thiolapillus brandeum TaxID=1076588 RepID=A0A7U6JID4_9GAMM|nr:phosphate regulon sensor histidine kinase PhoR [Thiolapillus brandeum]BAO45414.1 two-component system OmpR family phosphate regulon sensor histidine kinase PhoR [Thiolapillus brandeum]
MHDSFQTELGRLLVITLVILLFGLLSGVWWLAILIGLGGYSIWNLHQIYQMEEWLHGVHRNEENLRGIWRYIAARMRKISQRGRQRKKRLSRLLHRFYDTLEAMPDAAVILKEDLRVQWFNVAAMELLGLEFDDRRKQKPIAALIEYAPFADWVQNGASDSSLEMPSPADASRLLHLRLVSFGDQQSLLLAHDVTELKRVEAVRKDFIADVSHELRTPLTVVVGYLEMLSEEKLPEDIHQALISSRRQAERMQSIVADLLMLSRLEMEEDQAGEIEIVPVPDLLANLVEDARQLSGAAGHSLTLHVDESLGIRGNERQLSSAFGNLIFNAVRHTPAGTPIDIFWGREGEGARLVVADRGPGIAPEHLQRLTERFYRVDKSRSRERGGTGLGLSIVRHVLRRHDARIEITSVAGEGSRFNCLFPGQRLVKLSS